MEKQAIFTIRVNTNGADKSIDSTTKSMDNLQKSTNAAASENKSFEDRLKTVNETVKSGEFTMRGANKLIQEYQAIAMQAGRESPIGREAIAQAAALQDRVTDLRNEVTRLSQDGQAMQGALAIGSTVVAGYGAFKGVTAMLGVENEKLMETMVKMQAAQQVLMSIEQIRKALEKESVLMLTLKNAQTKIATAGTYLYAGAQKALAIATGAATGAAKLFRMALIGIGLGAIVVGIGMLIAHFDKLVGWVRQGVDTFNNLGEKTKLVLSIMLPFIGAIRLIAAGLESLGIIESQASKDAKKAAEIRSKALIEETEKRRKEIESQIKQNEHLLNSINETFDFEIAKARAAGKDTFELEKQKRAEYRKTLAEQIKLLEQSLIANAGNLAAQMDLLKQMAAARKAITKSEQDDEIAVITRTTSLRKAASKTNIDTAKNEQAEKDKLAKEEEDRQKAALERQRLFEDLMLANIEDATLREEMQRKAKFKREEEDLIAKYGNDTALLFELKEKQRLELEALDKAAEIKENERNATANKQALELKIEALKDDFAAQMEVKWMLWEMEREAELANKDVTEQERANIEEKYRQKAIELNQAKIDQQLAQEESLRDAMVTIQEQGMAAIQGLSDAVFAIRSSNAEKGSAKELALQKKNFEINKKLQIAQAIMQGYQAVLAAFASGSAVPLIGNVMGPAYAALAGVASAANIAKIKSTKFEGGGSVSGMSGGGASLPNTIAQQAPRATQEGELTNQNQESTTRVAVLESDITRTQNRITDIEVRTTF